MVYGGGLENRWAAMSQEFESPSLLQSSLAVAPRIEAYVPMPITGSW